MNSDTAPAASERLRHELAACSARADVVLRSAPLSHARLHGYSGRPIEDLDPPAELLAVGKAHRLQRRSSSRIGRANREVLPPRSRTPVRDRDAPAVLGVLHRGSKGRGPDAAAGHTADGKEMMGEIRTPRLHVAQEMGGVHRRIAATALCRHDVDRISPREFRLIRAGLQPITKGVWQIRHCRCSLGKIRHAPHAMIVGEIKQRENNSDGRKRPDHKASDSAGLHGQKIHNNKAQRRKQQQVGTAEMRVAAAPD